MGPLLTPPVGPLLTPPVHGSTVNISSGSTVNTISGRIPNSEGMARPSVPTPSDIDNDASESFDVQALREEYKAIVDDLLTSDPDLSHRERPKCKGVRINPKLIAAVGLMIHQHWANEETRKGGFWALNCLVYGGAILVTRKLGIKSPSSSSQKLPAGRWHPKGGRATITHYRHLISWLDQEVERQKSSGKATPHQHKIRRILSKVVGDLSIQSLLGAKSKYQSLLRIRSTQQRRKQQRKDASRLNKAYRRDGPKILSGRGDEPEVTPSSDEVKDFWYNLVGIPGECDLDHEAIRAWEGDLDAIDCNTERQEVNDIMWKRVVRKIKSWKAPGPDGIYGFWWKVFRSAGEALRGLIEGAINPQSVCPLCCSAFV